MATKVAAQYLHPVGSVGNITSTGVNLPAEYDSIAVQFVVEVAGATPTVTFKAQGSLDNTNWYDISYISDAVGTEAVTALTKTAIGASVIFLAQPVTRDWAFIRGVTSANTNVTYRTELYLSRVLSR